MTRTDLRVLHYLSREENREETDRCRRLLTVASSPEELCITMFVENPVINHSYYLLYQLAE